MEKIDIIISEEKKQKLKNIKKNIKKNVEKKQEIRIICLKKDKNNMSEKDTNNMSEEKNKY